MKSTAIQTWFQKLTQESAGLAGQVLFDEPLARHTYYRIGGPASVLVVPKGEPDLLVISRALRETESPFFLLGLGSNILASDEGYRGLVIKTGRINLETSLNGTRLRTGTSVAISTLLRRAAHEGWGGLEFLTGVPGSVGGAVAMNAGTHLGEARDRLRQVEAFSLVEGRTHQYSGHDLRYEYRKNLFLPQDALVTAAEWEILVEDPAKVKAAIDETLARRKSTQPIDYPSCGSVFKNPKSHGISAWQVVDKLGLRGHRIGDAQFAEKHSNFIINHGAARASDVRGLIDLAKKRAKVELGIELEEEVRYLGP